jgi:hypothetical protein
MQAGSFCPPQSADDFDDLGSIRAAMRQLECLVVIHENRPEADPKAVPKIRKLYAEIVDKLAARGKWDDDKGAWRRLYLLTVRINAIRNELARHYEIPVFSINAHHRATSIWIESARRRPAKTLLHLDSHSDTRGLRNPKRVLELGKRILSGKDIERAKGALDQYLNDPATPCSAGVLVAGFESFVWAKPSWYDLKDVVARPFFYGKHTEVNPGEKRLSKKWELYYDRSADTTGGPAVPADSTWKLLPKPADQLGKFTHVRRLKVSVLNTAPWPTEADQARLLKSSLLNSIPKGRFVLDIDLDYFGSVDLTKGLARKAVPSTYEGRNRYLSAEATKAREALWRKQHRYMDEQFKKVEEMLRFLREKGRIPTVVTLSDSAYMPFAIHWWAEEFWEYTPKRLVPYIQHNVRKILANVYASDSIGAIP